MSLTSAWSPIRLGAPVLVCAAMGLAAPPEAVAAAGGASSSGQPCVASWTREPVPQLGDLDNVLLTITGTSPTDLYAGGRYAVDAGSGGVEYFPRILRGTASGWADVPLPQLSTGGTGLTSSVSPAPGTAWFGGAYLVGGTAAPLLFHVTGSVATRVSLPPPPAGHSELDGDDGLSVASVGGSDLWVGGDYLSDGPGPLLGVVYRPTGSGGWTTTTIPSSFVAGIAPVSTSEAYIAGAGLFRMSNGTVSSVPLPGDPAYVWDVTARGASDVWASVGSDPDHGWLVHFDGTSWARVPAPDSAPVAHLAIAPNGVLWATGSTTDDVFHLYESTLSRYDPASQTWATVRATTDTTAYNAPSGSAGALLALASGQVLTAGFGQHQAAPAIARLCQLPVTLAASRPSATSVRALGDGVLVTAPQAMSGGASVTDSTGLLRTGRLTAGQGAALVGLAAGTYTLHSSTDRSVSLAVPAYAYTVGQHVTVQVAVTAAPAGYAYALQIRPTGSTAWRSTQLTRSTGGVAKNLHATQFPAGSYQLRSRVTNTATGVSSGWSPVITVAVP